MKNNLKIRHLLIFSILMLVFAVVACDGNDDNNNAGEPGVNATATDIGVLEETVVVDTPLGAEFAEETPLATEELMEATPEMMEETPMATEEMMEATAVMTETVVPTVAVEGTAEVMTETEMMTDTLVTQAILASDLVGMDITNDAGEEIGEVSELLIDEDGTLQHVLFDVGGFLGIGEKTVAVTADQFEIRPEEGTTVIEDELNIDDLTIFYTGTATDLEDLPAFETDMLDADGVVLREPEEMDDDTTFDSTFYAGQLQVSEFQDYNLLNMADEDIGEVEDLIVDLAQGKVTYAVVDVGGFLGIAETSIVVPWDQFTIETDGDDEIFRIDTEATALENAPVFDLDVWTYPIDVDWDADFHTYWDTQ